VAYVMQSSTKGIVLLQMLTRACTIRQTVTSIWTDKGSVGPFLPEMSNKP